MRIYVHDFSVMNGDTYQGLKVFCITKLSDSTPVDLTGVSLRAQFRRRSTTPIVLEMSTTNGKIEIHDPTNGKFKLSKQVITLPAADYVYDIEFTYPDGSIITHIKGTMTVYQDVTQ